MAQNFFVYFDNKRWTSIIATRDQQERLDDERYDFLRSFNDQNSAAAFCHRVDCINANSTQFVQPL